MVMARPSRACKHERPVEDSEPGPSSKRPKTKSTEKPAEKPKSARLAKLQNGPLKKPSSRPPTKATVKASAKTATKAPVKAASKPATKTATKNPKNTVTKTKTKTTTKASVTKDPAKKAPAPRKIAIPKAPSATASKTTKAKKRKLTLVEKYGTPVETPEGSEPAIPAQESTITKRKRDEETSPPVSNKKARRGQKVIINSPKSEVVQIFVCGAGDSGQLGLGAKMPESIVSANMDAKKPYLNKWLPSSENNGTVDLAVGGMHAAVLTKDNRVLTWGVNDVGALGRSTAEGEKFVSLDDTQAENTTTIYAKGSSGQEASKPDDSDSEEEDEIVETDLNEKECTPGEVEALESQYRDERPIITGMAAGDSCTNLVTDEGLVYGFGQFRGESGPLGFLKQGPQEQRTPILIPGLKKIKSLACGANHVVALDDKGAIFTWGAGDRGQLGRRLLERGSREKQGLAPEKCGPARTKFKYIAAGAYHNLAIDTKDNVWAWGQNASGQCGLPIEETESGAINVAMPTKVASLGGKKIVSISAGEAHSLAVTADGDILVWGKVTECQGGHDLDYLPDEDVMMVDDEIRALVTPTKIKFFGRRDKAQENEVEVKITSSACGTDHCAAITEDGKIYTWGDNGNRQCGLGNAPEIVKRVIEVDESGGAIHGKHVEMVGCGGSFTVIGTRAVRPAEATTVDQVVAPVEEPVVVAAEAVVEEEEPVVAAPVAEEPVAAVPAGNGEKNGGAGPHELSAEPSVTEE